MTANSPFRIGTRGSQLALWQANHVAAKLRESGHAVEVEVIRTLGDRMQDPAFTAAMPSSGQGIFTKEIEEALAAGRIDLAVHSLKDLPTSLDVRFTLAAILLRADARDAFVCEKAWGLHMLPSGATIATTSPRRKAMLLSLRPDITFVEMRGNIDSRLRKWSEGAADALVLACAGLDRLGRTESVHHRFAVDELTPAPGQGAMAIEVRSPHHSPAGADAARERMINDVVSALNDSATQFATTAERDVLAALGGGCQLPLGVYCHAVDQHWQLQAQAAALDGEEVVCIMERAPLGISAAELGQRAAAALKARGAMELLQAAGSVTGSQDS